MPRKGDNNKHVSARRGSSNQSNEGAKGGKKIPKSNHEKETVNKTSQPRNKKKDKNMKLNADKDQE